VPLYGEHSSTAKEKVQQLGNVICRPESSYRRLSWPRQSQVFIAVNVYDQHIITLCSFAL